MVQVLYWIVLQSVRNGGRNENEIDAKDEVSIYCIDIVVFIFFCRIVVFVPMTGLVLRVDSASNLFFVIFRLIS